MSNKIPFIYLEYRVHCHATEEEERVLEAIKNIIKDTTPDKKNLEGYFGNPIILFTGKVKSRKAIIEILKNLKSNDLQIIISQLEDRIDENLMLHIRLGKQAAYQNELVLFYEKDSIDIAMKIESFPASKQRSIEIAKEFLEDIIVNIDTEEM